MPRANRGDALGQVHRLFGEATLSGLTDAQLIERHLSQGDELAFNALVQRHGPMVLAVCRGVLNDANDADDAFQAVFLLLARKARTLWIEDSLGGWLHRVSCRIAFQVKADTVRRRQEERRAAELAGGSKPAGTPWDDTQTVVHEEIDRLPHRYRQPIVLCYLEHMTYEQAARHLSWSEATTQGRLARARNLLRTRLARRGVTVAGAVVASVAAPEGAAAASLAIFDAAVRVARQFGLGEVARAGSVSTAANAIVAQTLRSMMIAKILNIGAAALVVGTLTTVVVTSLPATGRTIRDEKAGRPASIVEKSPASRGSLRSIHARRDAASTSTLLPGYRGADLAPDGRMARYALRATPSTTSHEIPSEKTGPTVIFAKDLMPGRRLNRGDNLISALGAFRLIMEENGDLALYAIDGIQLNGELRVGHQPELMKLYTNLIWSAGTHVAGQARGPGSYCVMHADGNFVIYDNAGRTCLESGTSGYPGAFLRCQDDGNLVIYTPDLKPIWCSGTDAREPDHHEPSELEDAPVHEVRSR
jgi:RNA polymerase sigma factor (sigma-70 family)